MRAYAFRLGRGAEAYASLGFTPTRSHEWEIRGESRGARLVLDVPPAERGIPAGTPASTLPFTTHPNVNIRCVQLKVIRNPAPARTDDAHRVGLINHQERLMAAF